MEWHYLPLEEPYWIIKAKPKPARNGITQSNAVSIEVPVYLIHSSTNCTRGFLHINIVFWARVSTGTVPLEWHEYLLFKHLCSCILFLEPRRCRGLCLVFGHAQLSLCHWQLHIKPARARNSPISPGAVWCSALHCGEQNFCLHVRLVCSGEGLDYRSN